MDRARYRRIVLFSARQILSIIWWDLILAKIGLRRLSARTRTERMQRMAHSFRLLAVDMGGVMIKVGQFMSSRVDVLPPEITDELAGLQDEVPPVNFEEIQRVAEAEYGAPLSEKFVYFDKTPLAAASLGQVHRARVLVKQPAPPLTTERAVERESEAPQSPPPIPGSPPPADENIQAGSSALVSALARLAGSEKPATPAKASVEMVPGTSSTIRTVPITPPPPSQPAPPSAPPQPVIREVVVKIQRPHIELIIATDMAALDTVSRWIDRYKPIRRRADIPALIQEFRRTLYEEIDYLAEGRNAETFAVNFADQPGIRVPTVVWSHTTRRALTLENVWGIKITDYEAMAAAGIDRRAVAARLIDTYLQQIFEDGFFHADPHPGNLFVNPSPVYTAGQMQAFAAGTLTRPVGIPSNGDEAMVGGSMNRTTPGWDTSQGITMTGANDKQQSNGANPWQLTFVDFGMVGHVPENLRLGLREMIIGVGTRDSKRVIHSYEMMDILLPGANLEVLEQAAATAFDRFWGRNMTELVNIDPKELRSFATEFRQVLFEMPFQVPQDLIFLARAVVYRELLPGWIRTSTCSPTWDHTHRSWSRKRRAAAGKPGWERR
ncbi:MAG: AarF/ABC1/UbiB kinase family protein [Chloroflexi bacterium]|nr:AarF/ABC1/UbiB kinase family protein [Chloroflexota bacterium]